MERERERNEDEQRQLMEEFQRREAMTMREREKV